MKIVAGVLIAVVVILVVGFVPIVEAAGGTELLGYEVVRSYTDDAHIGESGGFVDYRKRANVEINNTANVAGFFIVNFFYDGRHFHQDLLYLGPGETGVASYIPFIAKEEWSEYRPRTDFEDRWDYEVIPVEVNTGEKVSIFEYLRSRRD